MTWCVILGFVADWSLLSGVVAFVALSNEIVSWILSLGLLLGMGLSIWALLHDWEYGPFGSNSLTTIFVFDKTTTNIGFLAPNRLICVVPA